MGTTAAAVRRNNKMKRRSTFVVTLGAAVACGEVNAPADDHLDVWLEGEPVTIVTSASALIGSLSDLAVDEDGRIYVLDAHASAVHVVDSMGNNLGTIGRQGEGPGELLHPASVELREGRVVIVDPGNQRLQWFDQDGAPAESEPIPECAWGNTSPTWGHDGTFVLPTLGFSSGLAIVCSAEGEESARLGELLAPGQEFVDLRAVRNEILEGEIPGLILNRAHAILVSDGSIWLTLPAAGIVKRFDQEGQQLVSLTLDEPEFPMIRSDWMDRIADEREAGLPSLQYLLAAREVDENLWILVNAGEEEPARILVITRDGTIRSRVHVPGIRGATEFTVDNARGWIYFYIADTAELMRVAL